MVQKGKKIQKVQKLFNQTGSKRFKKVQKGAKKFITFFKKFKIPFWFKNVPKSSKTLF